MRPILLSALLSILLAAAAAAQPAAPSVAPPAAPAHRPAAKPAKPKPHAAKPPGRPASARPRPAPPIPAAAPPPPAPAPAPEPPPEPNKGSVTGNPLPRFAALRADAVNMRTGPGTRYPITWVYKRRDLPVLIEREFEVWRLVEDSEGTKGWVHQATLVGRRFAVTADTPTHAEIPLRSDPKDGSPPAARLQPGVVIRLRSCDAASDWCQAQVQDYRGWVKRAEIWGVLPGEAIP